MVCAHISKGGVAAVERANQPTTGKPRGTVLCSILNELLDDRLEIAGARRMYINHKCSAAAGVPGHPGGQGKPCAQLAEIRTEEVSGKDRRPQ
jgi:hypothetical protein